jgi:hypothetical protein
MREGCCGELPRDTCSGSLCWRIGLAEEGRALLKLSVQLQPNK